MKTLYIKSDINLNGDEVGTISGYASVYGVVDSYSEVIDPGAFDEVVAEIQSGKREMPLMLANHEHYSGCPVGIWNDLSLDTVGLFMKGIMNPDVSQGHDIYSSLKFAETHKTKAKMGLSIGFYIANNGYEIIDGIGHIKKVSDLKEVSIVTFPANEEAVITSIKSAAEKGDNIEIIKSLQSKRDFEKFLRDSGICSKREAETFISVFTNVIKQTGCDTSADDYSQLSAKLDFILNRSF